MREATTNQRLPKEYQEVEFIETKSGGPRININYIGTPKTDSYEIKFQGNGVNGFILATENNTSTPYEWLYYYKANNIFNLYIRGDSTQTSAVSIPIDNMTHVAKRIKNAFYFDNVLKGNLDLNKIPDSLNKNYLLFGTSSYPFIGKIFNAKFWNSDNVLLRDFVPCFRKSDNEIGMYDLVGKQFYTNAGTGEFLIP